MIFNTFEFLVLFLVAFIGYWLTPRQAAREWYLLLASLVFYAWWDWRFLPLLIGIAAGTWLLAKLVHRVGRRGFLVFACVLLATPLLLFKYTNFLLDQLAWVLGLAPESLRPDFTILLPVGVSFFTFQGISYLVDHWRGHVGRQAPFRSVVLFIVFFPQLVAGPIVRASEFLPQLERRREWDWEQVSFGVAAFAVGFLYKAVLADNAARLVDPVFADAAGYSVEAIRQAVVGFHAQIYFDFAGYSLMAIGVARLFGYSFLRNFDFPYSASDITEFWRRWHMSLSRWLRDYIYIPLGGNRHGRIRQERNLLMTMGFGGVWHGASWNFVLWGLLHGVALVVQKRISPILDRLCKGWRALGTIRWIAAFLLTQYFVLNLWILFRAEDMDQAWRFFLQFNGLAGSEGTEPARVAWAALFLPVVVDSLIGRWSRRFIPGGVLRPIPRIVLFLLLLGLSLYFIPLNVEPFIYFQF